MVWRGGLCRRMSIRQAVTAVGPERPADASHQGSGRHLQICPLRRWITLFVPPLAASVGFPRFRTRTPPPCRPRQPTRRVLVQSRMRRRRATSPSVPSLCTTRNQPATMAPTYVPDTSRCRRLHALRHFQRCWKVTRATVSPPSCSTSTFVLSGVRISSGVSNDFCSPRP